MDKVFEKKYRELNPAQKKAVDAIEGPVLVIAGPGTGKTTILTLRIANILERTDTAPENILALTFTESGAFAMRRKLAEIIGTPAYKVNIHTFHGFAADIIERYPDYFDRIIGSKVISEPERIKIIKNVLLAGKVRLLRPYGDEEYYIGPILREIQILKRENISPEKFRKSIVLETDEKLSKTEAEKQKKQAEKNRELAHVYAEYEKVLAKEKLYDFEDMLLELIRRMEEVPEFKLTLQENFQYILADEHQDANAAQNRILELLSDFYESPNLFIVGDDKQAIYRFQGATIENFLYFRDKYRDTLIIDLEHNYRSHQGILDASHSLIENNPKMPGLERKRLKSLQVGSVPVYIREYESVEDEYEYVSESIARLMGNGIKSEEIAVLYRDNRHAMPISNVLSSKGIENRIESDYDIMAEKDIRKILFVAKAVDDLSSDENLAKALFVRELGADPGHVAELCALSRREDKPLYALVRKFSDTGRAYKWLSDLAGDAQVVQCTNFIQKLFSESGMLRDILQDERAAERLETVQAFFDHIASLANSRRDFLLHDLLEYLAISEEHGISYRRKYGENVSGVRLMTAHRAKGLEFDHVFILHAADKIWGNRSSRSLFHIPLIEHARNTGRIEDERRLFYVAMTRAKQTVNISFARRDSDKDLLPSQFLAEIDPAFSEYRKVEDRVPLGRKPVFGTAPKSGNSLLHPDFIQGKFFSQPLAVTHLNNYLECPWKYFFVNLIRIPQLETKHQLYGTAIHASLKSFFDAYKNGKNMKGKVLVDILKHNIEKLPFSKKDRREAIEKGENALTGYVKQYGGGWNRRILNEYSVKRVVGVDLGEGERLELTGKIDKVEFIGEREVVVVDYKTGKPKSRNEIEGRTKSADGNYKRQLAFYKLLLSDSARNALSMKFGEIDFIEPNERGIYKKERFEIDNGEVKEITDFIAEMARELITVTFLCKGCGKKDCEFCRLGEIIAG